VLKKKEYWMEEIVNNKQTRETLLANFLAWKESLGGISRTLDGLKDEFGLVANMLTDVQHDAFKLNTKKEYLEFWDKGFSNAGMKSLILDSVVPFLNDRTKIYAQDLTNGDVSIRFSTKTKLKTGEYRERFQVKVKNVNGADDYQGSSRGEKGRVDLGINFALSDLMSSRAKKSFPQRFFDEPFEGIDDVGLEAVMELLTRMVKECGTIFVVTHKPALQSLFNKVISVTKKNGETTIET
jgi:DNA repair exonuclease SbcCD ATPase subunit